MNTMRRSETNIPKRGKTLARTSLFHPRARARANRRNEIRINVTDDPKRYTPLPWNISKYENDCK